MRWFTKSSIIFLMINKKSKIFVTGHKGLVGSAIMRRFKLLGFKNIITVEKKK